MWEAGNHPNRFKKHDISDSHDYMNLIYKTISQADTSRLISPTSFWGHTHYGNYDGSMDYKGNPISPNPVIMEKLMTRGNQDAYTGYGATWSELRKAPYRWAASCINANDKAFSILNMKNRPHSPTGNWHKRNLGTKCNPTNGSTKKIVSAGNWMLKNGKSARLSKLSRHGSL